MGFPTTASSNEYAAAQETPNHWRAELQLSFEVRGSRSVLVERRHQGPLVVQRPFYPEPDGTCHCYLVHPPGGVVSGDELHLSARAGEGASVLLTTPAATKLYKSRGYQAKLCQRFRVASSASLEWLPSETIVFNAADARMETHIDLGESARFAAWEIICLGRPRSGEPFTQGRLEQRVRVERSNMPLLSERAVLEAGSAVLQAPWGLGRQSVFGSFYISYEDESAREACRQRLREILEESPALSGRASVSRLPGIVICRYLGDSSEQAKAWFVEAWRNLRPSCIGRPAVAPRIWAT